VIASDSEECRDALAIIDEAVARWPRPMLNPPHLVCNLDRDKLHQLLRGIDGLDIPATVCVTRAQLSEVAQSRLRFADIAAELEFPIIVRPRGSHAGIGLARIADRAAIDRYLWEREEQEFFVSRFVDYAGDDGLFRKYRVVFVDGRPYVTFLACALLAPFFLTDAEMRDFRAQMIGAVDPRPAVTALELDATTSSPAQIAEGPGYRVFAVRWRALEGVVAEGLLLEPEGPPVARVVALPDADWTPERESSKARCDLPPLHVPAARRTLEDWIRHSSAVKSNAASRAHGIAPLLSHDLSFRRSPFRCPGNTSAGPRSGSVAFPARQAQ